MPELTQITQTKKKRYALFFDGEFAFSLDEETFAAAGLHTGDTLEESEIAALRAICERYTPDNMEHFDAAIQKSLAVTEILRISIEKITGKCKKI